MLQSSKFKLENRAIIYQAIALSKKGTADFADYLIGSAFNWRSLITLSRLWQYKSK